VEKSSALESDRHSTQWHSSTNVHCRGHKNLSLEPVLRQLDPVHILPPHFFNTNFNINLPFTFTPSTDIFPSGYQKKIYEIWYKL
jgi:hypothetical protein